MKGLIYTKKTGFFKSLKPQNENQWAFDLTMMSAILVLLSMLADHI